MRMAPLLCLAAAPALAEPVVVPSGQAVEFVELIRDAQVPAGLTWRFRFVAPEIAREAGKTSFEAAAADMDFLCNEYAIPRLPAMGPRPRQIIISLSDAPVEFGQADPKITQFFEAYSVENDVCIWEGF